MSNEADIMNNAKNWTGYNPDDGDFMAQRQTMPDIEVWNISGNMCIAQGEDPIYITKEQAMKFFNLKEIS